MFISGMQQEGSASSALVGLAMIELGWRFERHNNLPYIRPESVKEMEARIHEAVLIQGMV